MSEHHEQCAFFHYVQIRANQQPELNYIFAIPNGGQRHVLVAAKLKREGVKPGVSDIFVPIARGGFHGLFIELKFGKNPLSKTQKEFGTAVSEQGYKFAMAVGSDKAIEILESYLSMKKNSQPKL